MVKFSWQRPFLSLDDADDLSKQSLFSRTGLGDLGFDKSIVVRRWSVLVHLALTVVLGLFVNHGSAQDPPVSSPELAASFGEPVQKDDSDKIEFFESKIRPVLIEHCYQCPFFGFRGTWW